MKTIGIVAEYNPLHYGHKYQLEVARNRYAADYIVVVMSGDFTQRGTPAIIDKHMRAKSAIQCGADLVIEIPVCFATADFSEFALGSVSILNQLGLVDHILFGSECGDLASLKTFSRVMNSSLFESIFNEAVNNGLSTYDARAKAAKELLPNFTESEKFVNKPNNLLSIYYLIALDKLSSKIAPLTHLRKGQGYLCEDLPARRENENEPRVFASATAIRKILMSLPLSTQLEPQRFAELIEYMPEQVVRILRSEFAKSMPIFSNDFSKILKHCITTADTGSLTEIYGITKEFAQAIKEHANEFVDYDSFCDLLLPYATRPKIQRRLCRLMINQTDTLMEKFFGDKITYYAHVLAESECCRPLISEMRSKSDIPIILQNKDAAQLTGKAKLQYDNDIKAEQIYQSAVALKFT